MSQNSNLDSQVRSHSKGLWIPIELERLGLSFSERSLLAIIDNLDDGGPEYCFASNKYLANRMDISESRVSFYITKLKRMKLIEEVSFTGRIRRLKCLKQNWYKEENSKKELCVKTRRQTTRKHVGRLRENEDSIYIIDEAIEERRRANPENENVVVSSEKKPKTEPPPKKPPLKKTLDCLENLDINDNDRNYLCTHFEAPTIEKAVAWATHPSTNIKTTLIKALMWACANPEKAIISQSSEESAKENKAYAKEVLTKAKIPSKVSVGLLNKYVEIYIQGAMQPDCINYDTPGFKKLLHAAMKKNKIE